MNPEHYVRPEGEGEPTSTTSNARGWRRAAHWFTYFMFNKGFDRNDPGIHTQTGFNANGRRHS
jgi:hypothetical protein